MEYKSLKYKVDKQQRKSTKSEVFFEENNQKGRSLARLIKMKRKTTQIASIWNERWDTNIRQLLKDKTTSNNLMWLNQKVYIKSTNSLKDTNYKIHKIKRIRYEKFYTYSRNLICN